MRTSFRMVAVTDLHRNPQLYSALGRVIAKFRPDVLALVGDFLDCIGLQQPQLTSEECAGVLSRFDVPEILFVRGNHEDYNWHDFEMAWRVAGRKLTKLHGQAAAFGSAVITGFPCYLGNERTFAAEQEELPYDPSMWLAQLVKQFGPPFRTLWLMHEPPARTPLTAPNTPVAGNSEWNRAIERFSPLLTISGHDHLTPIRTGQWFHRLGSTVCVNVGQNASGPLRHTLVEAEFMDSKPSLPSRMRVTAYPMEETIEVLPEP